LLAWQQRGQCGADVLEAVAVRRGVGFSLRRLGFR
jgi:hypothetical protein